MHPDPYPPTDHSLMIPVTEARAWPAAPGHAPLIARARVVLAGCFVVANIRLVEKPDGSLLVAMPNRLFRDGDRTIHRDVAFPVTHAMRLAIERAVLDAYRDATRPPAESVA